MNPIDREQLVSLLMLLVVGLFVSSGLAPSVWRRRLRIAAIVCFGLAVAAALADIGLWLSVSER